MAEMRFRVTPENQSVQQDNFYFISKVAASNLILPPFRL